MKIAIYIAIFLLGFSSAHAQALQKVGDYRTLTFTSTDGSLAHKSGNVFAQKVGDELKASYPSKVLDPEVRLSVFTGGGRKFFRLTWTCRIVRTSASRAEYYFDRRGTLLSGNTVVEAKRNVETEIRKSAKDTTLLNGMPSKFVRRSFSGSKQEGFWYIEELFMTAPK